MLRPLIVSLDSDIVERNHALIRHKVLNDLSIVIAATGNDSDLSTA